MRLSLIVGFALVGGLIVYGGLRGGHAAEAFYTLRDGGHTERRAPRFFGAANAFGHGTEDRANLDPLRPPGLPAGVRIDPKTGWMTGLAAAGGSESTWVTWADLAASDYEDGLEDMPPKLQALEGKRVAIAGFMKVIDSITNIRTFLLVGSHLACCYGTYPGPEGVIDVALGADQPASESILEPVLITGTLKFHVIRDTYRSRLRVALVFQLRDASIQVLGASSGNGG